MRCGGYARLYFFSDPRLKSARAAFFGRRAGRSHVGREGAGEHEHDVGAKSALRACAS